jgi:hypothetical protein
VPLAVVTVVPEVDDGAAVPGVVPAEKLVEAVVAGPPLPEDVLRAGVAARVIGLAGTDPAPGVTAVATMVPAGTVAVVAPTPLVAAGAAAGVMRAPTGNGMPFVPEADKETPASWVMMERLFELVFVIVSSVLPRSPAMPGGPAASGFAPSLRHGVLFGPPEGNDDERGTLSGESHITWPSASLSPVATTTGIAMTPCGTSSKLPLPFIRIKAAATW